ncbi:ubiquitin carboxyl-terminal hydrolase 37-like [Mercenaria mercenaria]|uniref:ubiquitin carboxyl-terminal hydrolase 37-like n=1 Tax=Mercenaria mercenaria TaxID=6596 RepID=UPI00234E6C59|nr:ubiquitin carboxyl-terminal hydrolase 37-like [Mercenaria mercenaria]XP_053386506.1 ubiquitin carboxyl-terminal hydrolase 37-like [Mercenaria mercenaria]
MKPNEDRTEVFPGMVKYGGCSGSVGSVKWKTGAIVIDKDDKLGWKIKMMLDCSENPILNYPLTADTLKKHVCKDTILIDVKRTKADKDLISFYLKANDKRAAKHIEALCIEVLTKNTAAPTSNSEVCINSTPAKSSLFTHVGNSPPVVKIEKENCSQVFTSMKSHKREPMDEDGKENFNKSYSKTSDQFLQRGSDKSRQCLGTLSSSSLFYGKSPAQPQLSSTPKPWLNSKRGPGLMPDPTPIKRARLMDSISYSMKMKPAQPTDTNHQQMLQGFSNLGNTCYMNAILQSLFGLETFSTDLMSNRRVIRTLQQQSLYYALVKLLYVKRQPNASDISRREALRRVKSAISTTAKRFSGYGQHDAHEFLGQVLDQLKEEVIKISKATPTPNKESEGGAENKIDTVSPYSGNNPITVNFEFEVLHTLTCLQCEEQVTKTEQFHDISLDVPKRKDLMTPRSLQDALSLFFKNEQIEYTCEKCGHGKSDVSHKITRLPRVFILHLKRYSYNQVFSKHTKMGQNVSVPTYLTMQNHCTEETQPAFPPTFNEPSQSGNKMNGLDDSKEDLPSRRKLEYPGYQFKSKTTSAESDSKLKDSGNPFTETKEKKDEVDSVLTLEDEDDQELSRAIEMSLKEQEEKDQMCRDYGEDSMTSFERVLELSRQERKTDVPKVKHVNQMTEEEMIQLAIEQSLMDTQTDDVIDHLYTRNSDVLGIDDHSYTGNYDIGPDGDNYETLAAKNHKTYEKRRHSSDSDLKNKFESVSDLFPSESTRLKENLSKSTKEEESIVLNSSISSEESERNTGESSDINNKQTSSNVTDEKSNKSTMEKTPGKACKNSWRNRLNNLSRRFSASSDEEPVNNELLCTEEMPENFEFEIEKKDIKAKCPGKVYELHNIDDLIEDESNKDVRSNGVHIEEDLNTTVSDKLNGESKPDEVVESASLNNDEDGKSREEKVNGLQRDCQLTSKGDDTKKTKLPINVAVDEFVFEAEDEDDSWLSLVEDKENKKPLSEKPKLSDPLEFSMDINDTSADEVDTYMEENIEIPEISNEKGELPYSYRLVSIVNHMGLSSATGHYLSDVYDMKKKAWYSFDDSHVTKISEAEVKSKRERSGYIFFYMSKDIFDDLALQHAVITTSKTT